MATNSAHTFDHSLGLVLLDAHAFPDDAVRHDASFKIAHGRVTELRGWGARGPYPDLPIGNEPESDSVHTVMVHDLSDASKRAIAGLARAHVDRYSEGRTWAWPGFSRLAQWASGGLAVDLPDETEDRILADKIAEARARARADNPAPNPDVIDPNEV